MSSSAPLYDRGYILLNVSNLLYSFYSVIFIFLPAYLYRLGIREWEIGLLMATGALVAVALKPFNAMIAGLGFRKTLLSAGAFLAAAATVPWIHVSGPGLLPYLLRIAQGAAFSMFAAASYSHIAASAPPGRRAEALGIFGLTFFLPVSVGGWTGEWVIRHSGYHGLFAGAIGIAVLAGLAPFAMREPAARERPSFASLSVYLTRPFLVPNTAGYLFGVAYGSIFTFLPVYLLAGGRGSIGMFVFIYALTVVATRVLGRRLLDRLPRERVSLAALLLLSAGNLMIPLAGTGAGIAAVGAAAGAGHGLLFPALSALVLDRVRDDSGGMAMAMFTGAFDMGLVTGAAVFGFVVELFGYGTMFTAAGAVVGAGSLAFFLLDPAFRKAGRPSPGP
jgi:predicted MFS family arabinose efflux permease